MKPTMTKLWHNEIKLGARGGVCVQLKIDWSDERHQTMEVKGPATPENVALALQRLALLIDADMAGRT